MAFIVSKYGAGAGDEHRPPSKPRNLKAIHEAWKAHHRQAEAQPEVLWSGPWALTFFCRSCRRRYNGPLEKPWHDWMQMPNTGDPDAVQATCPDCCKKQGIRFVRA